MVLVDVKGKKDCMKYLTHNDRYGRFPTMENELADWVDEERRLGMCVFGYMVELEAECILRRLYQNEPAAPFDANGNCTFKFGDSWLSSFFRRMAAKSLQLKLPCDFVATRPNCRRAVRLASCKDRAAHDDASWRRSFRRTQ
jgi:hypothetical protein